MPLVIPDVGDKADWQSKLLGKKITDSATDNISFAKKDLPPGHRIVEPGSMQTMDHKPDRLNIHVDKDGTVTHVKYG